MGTRSESSRIVTELRLALGALCQGCADAVRIACVPSGLEYRFIVSVEPQWRVDVYGLLARHTRAAIPPDGGPVNLSMRDVLRVCQLAVTPGAVDSGRPARARAPRRMAADLDGLRLIDTFQP